MDNVVLEVACCVGPGLPEVATQVTEFFAEVIPEVRQHDDTMHRLLVASVQANLITFVDMLAHQIPVDQVTVPSAAAEYARRFAQHELPLEALIRAYHLGEHFFEQRALIHIGQLGLTTEEALAVTAKLAQRTNRYIDQVTTELISIYDSERRRWDSRVGASQAARLRMVLENEKLTAQSAGDLLDTRMDEWHQAAIVWASAQAPNPALGLRTASWLLQQATGHTPTTTLTDDRTMWAWVSASAPPTADISQLRDKMAELPGLRIALGAPGAGLAGFRATFREALRARAVVEAASGKNTQVVAFDEVAVVALLTDHSSELRRWVHRVLGDLAANEPTAARLRETVHTFLRVGSSFTEAAAQLHLHKNTVHYRVRKAEELRGRALSEGRLDVEVALLACELLGQRISGTSTVLELEGAEPPQSCHVAARP